MAAPTMSRDGKHSQPYEDGGGYGKFRKRPLRRSQATPYDRPSTSIRNPGLQTANGNGSGWFSKLVDPAQKLISSGAQRFFASVFRKRLAPPPPTRPLEAEAEQGTKEKQVKTTIKDKQVITIPKDKQDETVPMLSSKVHVDSRGETSHVYDGPSSSNGGGATDLESMLKHKSFTRHEIDRLTALLQSRMVDSPPETGKNAEVAPSNLFRLGDKDELAITPVKNRGTMNNLFSTPVVLDQDVTSPAELAKAYMGSRPSKVSPSMLGFPSQPWKEDSAPQLSPNFISKWPTPFAIYRSSSQAGLTDNGFMTPNSRGRSAVYSMARTPYSRTQSTKMIQAIGTSNNAWGGRDSPSLSALENGRVYGSKQGTLKRRSSVLDNDIGSTGPIRRIRQKSNLMPTGALSSRGTRFTSNAERQLSLTSKPALDNKSSKENNDYNIHNSGFTPITSQSSEMASKILKQLDVLVSSREKSPSKLSPSKLRGQALRSLEKIDSSKFLESFQNPGMDAPDAGMLDDSQPRMPQNEDMSEQTGPGKVNYLSSKLGTGKTVETPTSAGDGAAKGVDSTIKPPQVGKPGFSISADEDFREMDDDDGVRQNATGDKDNMKFISSSSNGKAAETVTMGNPSVLFEATPQTNSTLIKNDDATILGNSNTFAVDVASSMGIVKHAASLSQSAGASDKTDGRVSGEKIAFQIGLDVANERTPVFSSSSPTAANDRFGASSNSQSESSERTVTAASIIVDPVAEQPEADKDVERNKSSISFLNNNETVPASLLASPPAGGIFSFGSGLQNGTAQTVSNSSVSVVPIGTIGADISANAAKTDSQGDFKSALAPPSSSSIFKFGSTPFSGSVSLASTNAGSVISQNKADTSFGSFISIATGDSKPAVTIAENSTVSPSCDISATEKGSALIGGTGVSSTSAGNSLFGGKPTSGTSTSSNPVGASSSAGTSTGSGLFSTTGGSSSGNNLFSATAPSTATGSSPFSFSAKSVPSGVSNQSQNMNNTLGSTQVAATGSASSNPSTTTPFSSTLPSPFRLSNSSAAPGNSLFSSSSAYSMFSSGPSFGATPSCPASEPNSVSSTASTSSPILGTSWSTPTLSVFSTVPNFTASSSGFVFGASSSAATAGTSVFGSSTSSSPFSFSAAAANPPPSTSFAFNSTPSFGSTPSGNNDQMSMEDSMAEDTVQATTHSVPFFSQPTSAPPSSGFVFGSEAPPSGPLQFSSTTPANPQFGAASPFQFGGHQSMPAAPPQNASPFQASGSLEFNAGGSFSLGTGGDKSNRRIIKVKKSNRKR